MRKLSVHMLILAASYPLPQHMLPAANAWLQAHGFSRLRQCEGVPRSFLFALARDSQPFTGGEAGIDGGEGIIPATLRNAGLDAALFARFRAVVADDCLVHHDAVRPLSGDSDCLAFSSFLYMLGPAYCVAGAMLSPTLWSVHVPNASQMAGLRVARWRRRMMATLTIWRTSIRPSLPQRPPLASMKVRDPMQARCCWHWSGDRGAVCVDLHEADECRAWAAAGECTRNFFYMQQHCNLTCSHCTEDTGTALMLCFHAHLCLVGFCFC